MLLTTLHWPDEIRSTKELELPDEEFEFKPAELEMAEQLVDGDDRSSTRPRTRTSTARRCMKVIEAKVEGDEIEQPEQVEESANLVDLMELLEASVKAATDTKTAGSTSRSGGRRQEGAREAPRSASPRQEAGRREVEGRGGRARP